MNNNVNSTRHDCICRQQFLILNS